MSRDAERVAGADFDGASFEREGQDAVDADSDSRFRQMVSS
jgi:hypothetical protein